MKIRTFEVEVVRTCRVKVTLPEALCTPEMLEEWESGLWPLDDGIDSIAKVAAEMAVNYPGTDNDGVGRMIENRFTKPDYVKEPLQVVAIVEDDDTESSVAIKSEWIDIGGAQ